MTTRDKLAGQVAVVTGGNSGIGLATARLFRDEGAKVVITASSAASFAKAKSELGDLFDVQKCDVGQLEEIDALYKHVKETYGAADILFANAGIGDFKKSSEVTPAFFDAQFAVNCRGLYFTVTKALPILRPGARVVLDASVATTVALQGSSVYSATKAAVRSFAKTWTAEIPVDKVRVNVVSPGPIHTDFFTRTGKTPDESHEAVEKLGSGTPMKRAGSSEEIAKAVLFLCSDDSSYVAGAELFVDGGWAAV